MLAPILSEAVEASGCYLFKNHVCLSKIPNLRIPKLCSNKILLPYFYLSEPIHNVQFNVRYPVNFHQDYSNQELPFGSRILSNCNISLFNRISSNHHISR